VNFSHERTPRFLASTTVPLVSPLTQTNTRQEKPVWVGIRNLQCGQVELQANLGNVLGNVKPAVKKTRVTLTGKTKTQDTSLI
jgi:hypothetical protein